VGIATRIFYRNPLVLGRTNVPLGEPLIIASNHPNALCDPCSIAVFSKQRIHFLARGDVFQNKILYWIFVRQLGMVPIYRLLEGAENLHKNEETFRISTEKLKQKKTILMFSEGICIQERRLRKLKKGTARIAFSSEESADWKLGLKVIPLGMNYTNPKKFRSDLVFNYGKPIIMKDFQDAYAKDKAIAINEFTKHLQKELSKLVVHIDDVQNDQLVSDMEEIFGNQIAGGKKEKFIITQKIVRAVNNLSGQNPEAVNFFRKNVRNYLAQIENIRVRDWIVKKEKISGFRLLASGFWLLLCFPFHLFGLINNYLPYKIGYATANRIVKQVEFHASVNMYVSAMLYLIFYLIQILSIALIFRNWWILGAYIILLPLSGLFSLVYYTFLKKTLGQWRFFSLENKKREEIIKLRKEIINELKMNFGL